jgi:hypothetical protein
MARRKSGTALAEPANPAAVKEADAPIAASVAYGPPPVPTGLKQGGSAATRFQPGVSGNPAGRAPGSRNKLAEDFLADMYRQYQESGPGILRDMATSPEMKDRVRFIELVHELLPRNAALDVNVRPALPKPFAEMTDADWEIALGIRVTKRGEQ